MFHWICTVPTQPNLPPLSKAGMRRAASYLEMFAAHLQQQYTGPNGAWRCTNDACHHDQMLRLSKQLYALARAQSERTTGER